VVVNAKNLDKFLGVRKYSFGMAEKENQVGQVTGLAWTEVGGELLTIEAVVLPGKGKTMTTGKLGEVMQESIQAALSVVRKRSSRSASPRTSTRRATSTSTCRKARPEGRPVAPASPSARRWCRC
jgi:ATP-dependent Lon protease